MSLSLREQLLAAGLGTKKQAKKAEHHERQQQHKDRNTNAQAAERQRAAQQAQAAKAARDQELNRQRQIQAEKREKAAQIKQLIEQNRLPKLPDSDEYFNFIHRQKVRRIPVDADLRARIMNGQVVLVRCEGKYDMVLPDIAAKIRERDERAIVELPKEEAAPVDENDPYKDFVVPDDLKW